MGIGPHQFSNWPEWLMLGCHTGLRPGEQRVLEFADIDSTHGFLIIRRKPHLHFKPKNYQLRIVPIVHPAPTAIEAMIANRHPDSDLVFHRPDGSPWGGAILPVRSRLPSNGQGRKKAPDKITPHSLRHTFAALCSLGGLSLRKLQSLLGPKSVTRRNGIHIWGMPAFIRVTLNSHGFSTNLYPPGYPGSYRNRKKKSSSRCKRLKTFGGGGATRTPDLGIMRPSL